MIGALIKYDIPDKASGFETTEIYGSSDNSNWNKLATLDISKNVYYDITAKNYYRIRFVKGLTASDYIPVTPEPMITTLQSVLSTISMIGSKIPAELTDDIIYDFITDATNEVNEANDTSYGLTKSFSSEVDRYDLTDMKGEWRFFRLLNLVYRGNLNITSVKVVNVINNQEQTLTRGTDYDYSDDGIFKLYYFMGNEDSRLKVEGTYGTTDIPRSVRELVNILASMKILIFLTGGSGDEITSYQAGELQGGCWRTLYFLQRSILTTSKTKNGCVVIIRFNPHKIKY